MMRGPSRRQIGFGFTISGAICLVVALVTLIFGIRFVATAERTDGRVIEMIERKGENGPVYAPVFSFQDAKGTEHRIHSSTASYPPSYEVGEAVRVLYSPDNAKRAKIDGFFSLWGFPFVTGIIGILHLGVGLFLLVTGLWRR